MKSYKSISLLIGLFVITTSCFDRQNYISHEQNPGSKSEPTMAAQLENTLKNINDTIKLAFRGEKLQTGMLIKDFFAMNQYLPVWTTDMAPNRYAREMMRLFARSAFYGLDKEFYQFRDLSYLYDQLSAGQLKDRDKKALEFEILMTHNSLKIMSNLHYGIIKPDTSIYRKNFNAFPKSFPKKLISFINDDLLTEGILNLQPKSYEYRFLQAGLENFVKTTTLNSDTFFIADLEKDSAKAYETIRKVLVTCNYYPSEEDNIEARVNYSIQYITSHFIDTTLQQTAFSPVLEKDTALINGLKRFQKANGLHPDGVIGSNTKNALAINNQERFKQLAINLERLRWEKKRPKKYIYVNIPSYKLRVLDKAWIKKTFRVVVGAVHTQTPELNGSMEYFITSPRWNVPYSITSKELIPKIIADSTYLAKHNYRLLDANRQALTEKVDWSKINRDNFKYTIQQGSGSNNALGSIKFIFPNPYNVYIHDTQSKSKFNKEIRAYSHGCMRLDNPIDLAKYLIKDENNISADSLTVWIAAHKRKRINLSEPVPVYVRYITCEADKKGNITFYKDIYGKDEALKKQLFASR